MSLTGTRHGTRRPADRLRRLSLRARLGLLAAVAVAVAVSAASVAAYVFTGQQLARQLDSNLRSVEASPGYVKQLVDTCGATPPLSDGRDQRPSPYTVQVVRADGTLCADSGNQPIRATADDLAVARGLRHNTLHDAVTSDGRRMRVATSRPLLPPGIRPYAVSIAQPLDSVDQPLRNLAFLLLGVAGIGVLAAASAGVGIARAGLRPVERLTATAEHIARTEDLTVRIPSEGQDEIARLSQAFNAMTQALASSRDRQQQLIADAGHELRTPLTSLRTNIELLAHSERTGRAIPAAAKRDLLDSVTAQIGELAGLIGDLQELSRPDRAAADAPLQVVAFHEVVGRALERARRRGTGLRFTTALDDWYVLSDPAALERAVLNLLDNAVKFSPADGEVRVRLAAGPGAGVLTVRDAGPGIPEDELPYVFDRFWRSPTARALPGSGLGLSIVAQTVQRSGGSVALRPVEPAGTEAVLRLPGSSAPPVAAPRG
ncbi:cell wall metabolism sensor histidine kinase WalK [Streptomyces sp. VRA16 Mangrove soil]|uniref:sensor histidine kinase n=1 Tax=Streptomyces sp. VRA16 Mangrove soil TaxID=2817434 RepID=UPI001A9DE110|nr:HAMP domain-containing sensor histidine kinase [Streptomyces sp. VRA16 Mangrove soil]MBO1336449.1 HAMP domain-containing histidine kinase [Streptomyces sp. VRA16 Mangrove soil]